MKKVPSLLLGLLWCLSGQTAEAKADTVFNDVASFTVAKVSKLGRGAVNSTNATANLSFGSSAGSNKGTASIAVDCDSNCLSSSCNRENGKCSKCNSGRYLNNDLCMSCPSNATCDGVNIKCNSNYMLAADQKSCKLCTTLTLSNGAVVDAATQSGGGPNGVTAEQKCASLGKRLPTLGELQEIYNKQPQMCGLTDGNDAGGWPYWSERIAGTNEGYRMIFAGGAFGSKGEIQRKSFNQGSGAGAYIRCIKGCKSTEYKISGACTACPANATCDGTNVTCYSGYTLSSDKKTCQKTSCPAGSAWRTARSDGRWAAGCYPIGNCNTVRSDLPGATCMFVDSSGNGQCKTDSVWSSTSCRTCPSGYTKNAGGICIRTCTGSSASTCSAGCAWRTSYSNWAAGCYPVGNCPSVRSDLINATCMYVSSQTGEGQCKTDNIFSGSTCSIAQGKAE